jgi:hypothetical protein
MPTRVKIVAPAIGTWGAPFAVAATGYDRSEGAWLRAEAQQSDALVYAQYVRGAYGSFTLGPTPAADETQPATGRVAIGYWTRQGTFRELASTDFEIEAP